MIELVKLSFPALRPGVTAVPSIGSRFYGGLRNTHVTIFKNAGQGWPLETADCRHPANNVQDSGNPFKCKTQDVISSTAPGYCEVLLLA